MLQEPDGALASRDVSLVRTPMPPKSSRSAPAPSRTPGASHSRKRSCFVATERRPRLSLLLGGADCKLIANSAYVAYRSESTSIGARITPTTTDAAISAASSSGTPARRARGAERGARWW